MLNLREVARPPLSPAPLVRPMLARSIVTVLFLCAGMIAAFLLLVVLGLRLTLLRQISAGFRVERSAIVASDGLVLFWSKIWLLAEGATAVAFLAWLYRANENVRALRGESLEFTPGQAVWSFFIPFVNLVRPYEVMREVWRASSVQESKGGGVVPLWWALFLGRGVSGWLVHLVRQWGRSPLEKLVSGTYGALAMYLLSIGAALAAIALVVSIERRVDALSLSTESAQGKES